MCTVEHGDSTCTVHACLMHGTAATLWSGIGWTILPSALSLVSTHDTWPLIGQDPGTGHWLWLWDCDSGPGGGKLGLESVTSSSRRQSLWEKSIRYWLISPSSWTSAQYFMMMMLSESNKDRKLMTVLRMSQCSLCFRTSIGAVIPIRRRLTENKYFVLSELSSDRETRC